MLCTCLESPKGEGLEKDTDASLGADLGHDLSILEERASGRSRPCLHRAADPVYPDRMDHKRILLPVDQLGFLLTEYLFPRFQLCGEIISDGRTTRHNLLLSVFVH
jgi:hypothetical protein